jgi:hypothetical protein
MPEVNFAYHGHPVPQGEIRDREGVLCGIEDERNHQERIGQTAFQNDRDQQQDSPAVSTESEAGHDKRQKSPIGGVR